MMEIDWNEHCPACDCQLIPGVKCGDRILCGYCAYDYAHYVFLTTAAGLLVLNWVLRGWE